MKPDSNSERIGEAAYRGGAGDQGVDGQDPGARGFSWAGRRAGPADGAGGRDRRPGSLATIVDVANLAGVSRMTVSRVINGSGSVAPATRAAVLESIGLLNYVPSLLARHLAVGGSARIGVFYACESAQVAPALLGVLPAAQRHGIQLVAQKLDVHTGSARCTVLRRLAAEIAGAILLPPLAELAVVRRALRQAGVPAVAIAAQGAAGVSCLRIDEFAAAFQLTSLLLSLGHRAIAFIDGSGGNPPASARRLGFEAAVRDHGIAADAAPIIDTERNYRCGMLVARRILSSHASVTAIFGSHDEIAAGASAAAQQCGVSVPDELSVVGFGDSMIASRTSPELTTVRIPFAAMAAQAVELLAQAIRQQGTHRVVDTVLPHEIIGRGSVAPPSASLQIPKHRVAARVGCVG